VQRGDQRDGAAGAHKCKQHTGAGRVCRIAAQHVQRWIRRKKAKVRGQACEGGRRRGVRMDGG